MSKISILIPAYMENENLPKLVKALERTLQGEDFEVIIVNDGNLDGSIQTIKELERKYSKVKGYFCNRRRGKTMAIKEGFKESCGGIIVIIDADLQYSPKDVPRLIGALKHADAINGLRIDRRDSLSRKIESKIYNILLHLFFNVKFYDCNSGLKVFKRGVLKEVVPELRDGWHRYLLVLVDKRGYRVLEKPIIHYKRTAGRSKFTSPLKLFKGLYNMLSVKSYLLRLKRGGKGNNSKDKNMLLRDV